MQIEQWLSVLNKEQREAVVHDGKSLLILAGAGSGKTRVITTKIAYLISQKQVDPFSILAVTFTKKAAREMQERAVQLEPRAQYAQIRTFHSFGAYFLRTYSTKAALAPNFTVYDDDDMVTLVSKANPSLSRQQASHAAHLISLAKDYCLLPESERLYEISDDEHFADIYANYQTMLKQTGNVDFGDLILLPYLVLKNNPEVRKEIHLRYRVIMVDEYQDSNVAQFLLLQQLAGVEEHASCRVCVVGDDDQSIYKFRGAEVQNILQFQHQFPETKLIRLETNYRSSTQILACADAVVSHNKDRLGKTLVAAHGEGKKPTLVFLPNQDDEASFCADLIEQLHEKKVPYGDWAILYRTNAQSLTFETEFLHRKIPYKVVGSLKFYEREEIKDVLAWLAFLANPRDQIAFRRIVNKPARGIGATSQDKIVSASAGSSILETARSFKLSKKASEGIQSFCAIADELNSFFADKNNSEEKLSAYIQAVVQKSELEELHKADDELTGTNRIANMQELINSAVLYPCTNEGLLDFLDHIELDRTLENEANEIADAVTLITLHNTKGLEFPRVIITGMESGVFPREDKTGAELEEERRLFYVGITRAKNDLYFTSCALRRLYGRTNYMSPSPFLHELGEQNVRMLGQKPASFESVSEGSRDEEGNPLSKKWHVGLGVYHDDYGHGQIVKAGLSEEGEYVISVSFENGGIKRFLPKYQSSALMVEENV